METDEPSTTQRPTAPERRLHRSPSDRIVAGVAGGLGEYFGVDAVLFRIAFVALTVAGGSGLVLYGLGWLLLPEAGIDETPGERLSNFFRRKPVLAVIATVIAINLIGDGFWWDGGRGGRHDGLFGVVLLVLGAAFLVTRHRGGQGAAPPPPTAPGATGSDEPTATRSPSEPEIDPLLADAFRDEPVTSEIWPPLPPGGVTSVAPRPRPFITPVTISLLLIFGGVAALFGLELQTALAIALLIVGVAMLIGSRRGRARGLLVIGLLLAAMTTVASVADVSLAGGTGERQLRPILAANVHPYRLGAGELTLDLTHLKFTGAQQVKARVGMGSLKVLVPADADVVADTHVGVGQVDAFGRHEEGPSIDRVFVHDTPNETAKRLHLDLDAGFGEINVEVR